MNNKILISEDNEFKSNLLINELKKNGVLESDIIVAKNSYETRCALRANAGYISLLLLDLVLPNREGDTPSANVGLELLKLILEDDEYHPPRNIVGTTADGEARGQHEADFQRLTTQILLVTPELNDWRFSLERLVNRINRSNQSPKESLVDVCFVTALRQPELEAVLNLPIEWTPEQSMGNGVLIQEGTAEIGGKPRTFICAHSTSMGMIAATFMVRALWERYYPKLIIMTGICGGVRGVKLGDAIIADRSWDWQSGKWLHDGEFESAPDHKEACPELVALARGGGAVAQSYWREQSVRPTEPPTIKVGPMVSGSAVVEDQSKHNIFIQQHRKAIAVDMECFGVYFAARMSVEPEPKVLCIKCVSDLADRNKTDNFQVYCSELSAKLGFDVAERYFATKP